MTICPEGKEEAMSHAHLSNARFLRLLSAQILVLGGEVPLDKLADMTIQELLDLITSNGIIIESYIERLGKQCYINR